MMMLACYVAVVDVCAHSGYSWAEDKEHCEEYGRMLSADPSKVSTRAKKRGLPQVSVITCEYIHITCAFGNAC